MDRLDGVDVSGWDDGIDLASLTADFVIVKATEGVQGTVYNPKYREMADSVLSSGKLLGFFHYANGGDAVAEADCFFEAVKDYRGKALLALDWEGQGNAIFGGNGNVAWCKTFLDRIRERFGGTPVIYISKDVCNERDWSRVAVSYPLWGAEYAYDDKVYQGYQSQPWQSQNPWGAWGDCVAMHQYGYVNPRPNNGGKDKLDGEVFYGNREAWERLCGNGGGMTRISLADIAARIHYDMVTDERNGYSQKPRWGNAYGITKTLVINGRQYSYAPGEFDCSSSVITAWRLALQGTPYEGRLDGATCTSDMRKPFIDSGLFYAKFSAARRGDLYLAEGKHVAMCQDGGSDGVFGYDCLSEFNRNENHAATGGKPGDQDGGEAIIRGYYDDEWNTVLHYNGKGDYEVSEGTHAMLISGHVQGIGWMPFVPETDVIGTTGQAKRLEGLRFDLPDDIELRLGIHEQRIGDITYQYVRSGISEFTFGSEGAGMRMESMMFDVLRNDNPATKGKRLQYRVHQQTYGWTDWVDAGTWAGVKGQSKRIEAMQCRWV